MLSIDQLFTTIGHFGLVFFYFVMIRPVLMLFLPCSFTLRMSDCSSHLVTSLKRRDYECSVSTMINLVCVAIRAMAERQNELNKVED